jgi:NitT/TauT family transport system substrate-binding protein
VKRASALIGMAALAAAPWPARAQGAATLKAAGVPEESATPVLWGVQSGMFKQAGVDVSLEAQSSGAAITAGVVGGSYDVGKSSIVPLIIAFSKKIPFKLVAPGGLYRSAAPNIAMIVSSESPLRTAADLNGKVVGVSSPDDLYSVGLKAWMDKNGGNAGSLKFIAIPQSEIQAALAAGRIDAGASGMPQLQAAVDSKKARVLCDMCDAISSEFMFSAWFASDQMLAKTPAPIATFSKVERRAAAYVNEHHAQTVAPLSAFTHVEPAVITKMVRATMGTALDPKYIQPVIDVCARYNVIPQAFDARTMIAANLD